MNYSRSWAHDFKYYEKFVAVNDMKAFGLWAQGFRSYEQLRVVDDMSYSR